MRIEVMQGMLLPFCGTALGAACALFMRKELNQRVQRALTGFVAGAMAYVVVEALIPEMSQERHPIWVRSFSLWGSR